MWVSFLKLIIVFPIVITLLMICLKWMQKQSFATSPNKKMKIMEQIRLSPKTNLSIVKVADEYLVIACNDEQIEVISKLTAAQMEAETVTDTVTLPKWIGGKKND